MDDNGGEQVEPGHAIVLALARTVANLALAPDPQLEAQPVMSPTPHPDMLDVIVGQRVMVQQGGFVRGKVEQGRALQMLRLGMFHLSVIRSSRHVSMVLRNWATGCGLAETRYMRVVPGSLAVIELQAD